MGNVNADRGLPGNLRWSACCQKRPSVAERCQRCVSRVYTCALASPELVRSRLQRARYGRQRDTCALARPCKRDVAGSDAHDMLLGSRHERAKARATILKDGCVPGRYGCNPRRDSAERKSGRQCRVPTLGRLLHRTGPCLCPPRRAVGDGVY